IGFYFLFFSKYINVASTSRLFILLWMLITPIPASFTIDVPHAVRTMNFLPTFQIVIALGLISFITYISHLNYKIANIKLKNGILALCVALFFFNFVLYLDQY